MVLAQLKDLLSVNGLGAQLLIIAQRDNLGCHVSSDCGPGNRRKNNIIENAPCENVFQKKKKKLEPELCGPRIVVAPDYRIEHLCQRLALENWLKPS